MRAARRGKLGPDALAGALARAITDKRRTRTLLTLVGTADRDPAVRRRLSRFIREVRGRLAIVIAAADGPADPDNIAFLHNLVVGAAVLHLARDTSAARREARAVLRKGVATLTASKGT